MTQAKLDFGDENESWDDEAPVEKVDSGASEFTRHRHNMNYWAAEFKQRFDLNLKDFYGDNAFEIMMFGFDIVEFSDALSQRKFKQNWADVESPFNLEEFITLEYGFDGWRLIQILL